MSRLTTELADRRGSQRLTAPQQQLCEAEGVRERDRQQLQRLQDEAKQRERAHAAAMREMVLRRLLAR